MKKAPYTWTRDGTRLQGVDFKTESIVNILLNFLSESRFGLVRVAAAARANDPELR